MDLWGNTIWKSNNRLIIGSLYLRHVVRVLRASPLCGPENRIGSLCPRHVVRGEYGPLPRCVGPGIE